MPPGSYKGLSTDEVVASRKKNGENILNEYGRKRWSIFFEVLIEPMMILLVVACSIYFVTGEVQEGIIMALAIIVVTGISIYQQIKSEHAVKALKKLSQPLTSVIRDGNKISIPSEELVVDDVMIVSEGQQVAADAVILDANDLAVNESILTGESFAVSKDKENNQLFSGTTVTSGLAHTRVISVGNNTRIGKLGIVMESIVKEKTPLQKQINVFVKRMALFGFIAFVFVWVYNYFESGSVIHGLMHGLTLAMAVLPEEIPVALSTFMALGAYRMIRNHVLVKQPQTVEALGAATVICVDKTGTITENKMEVAEVYDFESKKIVTSSEGFKEASTQHLLLIAMLASESLPFDPMEKAIHNAFDNAGIARENYTMIKEYPLSGTHPFMTHIYKNEKGERIITCKGAPEGIIGKSDLNEQEKQEIILQLKSLATKGNRVLAVATSDFNGEELPAEQTSFQWKFLGLVALSDPPKKNIVSIIKSFYDAGIEVKMITGDFPETAVSIAKQIQLKNPEEFITGQQLTDMNDEQLADCVSHTNIFARIMPEMKLRIINALKKSGEVVAMTGDGVNDGTALKAAHIGIAMGNRGSEVARQAASLVLVNDDLSGMVTAVELGRKIYSNLKKAIQYIISIHIPLISIVTFPLILGWKFPNIFTPVHVIFLEIVMGPTCSIVYENEPMEKNLIKEKPRKLSIDFFNWRELSMSALQGIAIACGMMFVLFFAIHTSLNESSARTMVFTALIFSNILLTLTGRSKIYPVYKTILYKNKLVPLVIFATLAFLALAIYYAPLQAVFGFQTISIKNILICFATAFISVIWIELYKIRRKEI
ncbi:MAG: cation-translocating P-type ATPase [Bacteroidia bacterium]